MLDIKELAKKMEQFKSMNFNSSNEIIYKCKACKDEGGYIEIKENIEYYKQCDCFIQSKTERLLKSSKITADFFKMRFASWDTANLDQSIRNAHKCALQYSNTFESIKDTRHNSIALLGKSGSGKTHLLTAVSNSILESHIPLLYFPYVEGFNEIKDNFELLESKINRMQTIDVLFIDDLFKGRKEPTSFQIEQIFAVINYRYLNRKPMLISSEKSISELLHIDEAIGSRIYEMSKNFIVEIQGTNLNYRLRSD